MHMFRRHLFGVAVVFSTIRTLGTMRTNIMKLCCSVCLFQWCWCEFPN